MKVYLDVSCLCRPFDDQSQVRVRLEAEAIGVIFSKFISGEWQHVSSKIAEIEIEENPDDEIRRRVLKLLPAKKSILRLKNSHFTRGQELESIGFKPADALHLAAAEALKADVFLCCDDRMCRLALRKSHSIQIRVTNPITWLQEYSNASDSR